MVTEMTDITTREEAEKLLAEKPRDAGDLEPDIAALKAEVAAMPKNIRHSGVLLLELTDAFLKHDARIIGQQRDLARSVIALHAELDRVRADLAAAQAMVVERAAKHILSEVERLAEGMQQTDPALEFLRELAAEVVALAPVDGLAVVQELRAEAYLSRVERGGAEASEREIADDLRVVRAERDTLAADLATLIDRLCAEADRLYLEGKMELPGPKLRARVK